MEIFVWDIWDPVLSYTFPVHLHFSEIKAIKTPQKIQEDWNQIQDSVGLSYGKERNETHGGLIFYYVGDIYIFIVLVIHVYFTNHFVCIIS